MILKILVSLWAEVAAATPRRARLYFIVALECLEESGKCWGSSNGWNCLRANDDTSAVAKVVRLKKLLEIGNRPHEGIGPFCKSVEEQ